MEKLHKAPRILLAGVVGGIASFGAYKFLDNFGDNKDVEACVVAAKNNEGLCSSRGLGLILDEINPDNHHSVSEVSVQNFSAKGREDIKNVGQEILDKANTLEKSIFIGLVVGGVTMYRLSKRENEPLEDKPKTRVLS